MNTPIGNTVEISKNKIENSNLKEITSLSALEEDILSSLHGSERYGLEIVKTIEIASDGRRIIGIGSLYPTLRKLEKKGLVTSKWDTDEGGKAKKENGAKRKYYKITTKGSSLLIESRKTRDRLINFSYAFP